MLLLLRLLLRRSILIMSFIETQSQLGERMIHCITKPFRLRFMY